ncbi:carboxypeptidase-like regulatory domain-containing protein [Leeuwenhoekiella sp. MAR_2009_132]|uniref:carboxypeptidase-like regulatory domain-containing protein n=1 Tax=Leeuwenhoekiella sp. MAR_2009_132 TaxID=1392489 RepID=UPI00048E4DBF|nr:carboxypeptidase-like regulatory domain-containing protein [Leeuwenhoekiella sp. MAR_2009_132]
MIRVAILFLVLFTGTLAAQSITLEGSVIDAKTQQKIPFANLIFSNYKIGTSANAKGDFKFTISEKLKNETVLVSCVGYNEEVVKAHELNEKPISLTQKTNELSEVTLYKMRLEKQKRINSFRGKQIVGLGNFSGGAYPSALARYYERPRGFEDACFIKEIEIQFYRILGKSSQQATFRLRILDVSQDGKPGRDLLDSDIIITKPEGNQKLTFDLSAYKVNVPEAGFFVSVEHIFIEENKFSESYTLKVNDTSGYREYKVDRYAPIFKGIETSSNNTITRCFYKSINGWKSIDLLNTEGSALNGKFPAPAFKLIFTD